MVNLNSPAILLVAWYLHCYRIGNSGVGVQMTLHVPLYPAAVWGLLCLTILVGPASANIKDPVQGCSALLNCADNRTSTPTTSVANPSTIDSAIASEDPEYEALPLPLMHPEFFGYINQDPGPAPILSAAIASASSDPVPEPASLAILGAALLWFRMARGRRTKV